MESDAESLAQTHREMLRAEAAPYLDYPPTPRWYPPAAGLWSAGLVGAGALTALESRLAVLGLALLGVLIALNLGFLRWYGRYHGALPSLKNPPAEFRPLFQRYVVGTLVVLALVAGSWWLLGWVAAAATAFVSVTAALSLYERAYAATAAATRARLA